MPRQWDFRQPYGYLLAAVCFLTEVSACTLLMSPKREVSIVSHIDVPVAVKARKPFAMTVYTEGGRPMIPDRVDVRVAGLSAEVTPYDIIEQSGIVRIGGAWTVPRSVSLQFDIPGIAIIRVIGRDLQKNLTVRQTEMVVLPP